MNAPGSWTTAGETFVSQYDIFTIGAGYLDKVWLPYGIAILAQLPMIVLYARELWSRPHYQFAPFAVLATCLIAYNRWPRDKQLKYYRSSWSVCLFVMGIVCCLAGCRRQR